MVCVGMVKGCKLVLFPWLQDNVCINSVRGNVERLQTHFVSMVTGHCVYGVCGNGKGKWTVHFGRTTGYCCRDGTKVGKNPGWFSLKSHACHLYMHT